MQIQEVIIFRREAHLIIIICRVLKTAARVLLVPAVVFSTVYDILELLNGRPRPILNILTLELSKVELLVAAALQNDAPTFGDLGRLGPCRLRQSAAKVVARATEPHNGRRGEYTVGRLLGDGCQLVLLFLLLLLLLLLLQMLHLN